MPRQADLHGLLQQDSLIKHYDDISIIQVSRRAGLKLGLIMKEVYELDVYKLAEGLSDMIWYAFYSF